MISRNNIVSDAVTIANVNSLFSGLAVFDYTCCFWILPRYSYSQLILDNDKPRIDSQHSSSPGQHDKDPEVQLQLGPLVSSTGLADQDFCSRHSAGG
jgi:hypothetical protein